MNYFYILAAHGDPASRYFQHFGVAFFLTGLLCLLIGLLVGWLAWRYCRRDAERIETENQRLEASLEKYVSEIKGLASEVDQIEKS